MSRAKIPVWVESPFHTLPQGIGQVARLLTREGDAVRVFAEVREGAETGEGCH
jgi:hypothetical protein